MAARRGRVAVSITADNSGLHHGLAQSERDVARFGKVSEHSLAGVRHAAELAIGVTGLGGLAFGLKDVATEAVKAQAEENKLAQAVKNAGFSWKAHREEVEKNLSKLSETSGFAKSDLSASLANMIRTTHNLKNAWKDNAIAMDLARTKGIDLAGAQSLVARAALGNTRGLKSLGIEIKPVTKAQDQLKAAQQKLTDEMRNSSGATKDQIRTAKEHLASLKSQATQQDQNATRTRALTLLQQKFSGQSAAFARSTAGQFEQARQSMTIAEEDLGAVLLPVIAKAAMGVADLARGFSRAWPAIQAWVSGATKVIEERVNAVRAVISNWVRANRTTLNDLGTIFKDVAAVVRFVIDKEVIPTVQRLIPAISAIFGGLARVVKGAVEVIAGVLTLNFGKAWQGVEDIFSGALKALGGIIRGGTAPFRQVIAQVGSAIGGGFSAIWSDVLKTATGFINRIIDVINVLPGVSIHHVGGGGKGGASFGGGGDFSSSSNAPVNPPRKPQHRATGGMVTQPTAIVGEEAPRHPEFVIATNPAYRQRNIGLLAQASKALGIPGFALGGELKNLPVVGHLLGGLKMPGNPFGGSVLSGLGSYVLSHVAGSIGGLVKSVFGGGGRGSSAPVGGGTAAGSAQVRAWAAQALRYTHHYSAANLDALVARIMFESGGNPDIVNTTDINAQLGHPSIGLAQVIAPTFATYRDKRLPNNLRDPLANLVAAINYMYARYGHVVGNTGVGYAMGGVIGGDGSNIEDAYMAASSGGVGGQINHIVGGVPAPNGPASSHTKHTHRRARARHKRAVVQADATTVAVAKARADYQTAVASGNPARIRSAAARFKSAIGTRLHRIARLLSGADRNTSLALQRERATLAGYQKSIAGELKRLNKKPKRARKPGPDLGLDAQAAQAFLTDIDQGEQLGTLTPQQAAQMRQSVLDAAVGPRHLFGPLTGADEQSLRVSVEQANVADVQTALSAVDTQVTLGQLSQAQGDAAKAGIVQAASTGGFGRLTASDVAGIQASNVTSPDTSAIDAMKALTDAINSLKDEEKRHNDIVAGVQGVDVRQATRFAADVLSGEIAGRVAGKALTAGAGTVFRA